MDLRSAMQVAVALVQAFEQDGRMPVVTRHQLRVVRYMLGVHHYKVAPDVVGKAIECGILPRLDAVKFAHAYQRAEKALNDKRQLRRLKHAECLPGYVVEARAKPVAWRPRWERKKIVDDGP